VAESLDYIATSWRRRRKDAPALNAAVQKVIQKIMKDHGRIIFNGDNYSAAWHKEAAKRGLPNSPNTEYIKDVMIEARLAQEIAKTMILPAAVAYQKLLAETSGSLKALGKKHCTSVLDELCELVAEFQVRIEALREAIAHEGNGDAAAHAKHCRNQIVPAMDAVREIADALEGMVADEYWPLPTYQEMLFIK
jgi:glutamine synthetase